MLIIIIIKFLFAGGAREASWNLAANRVGTGVRLTESAAFWSLFKALPASLL